MSAGRTALLVGATGLIGARCLEHLLVEPRYQRVVVLARRRLERADPRLEARVVDFDRLAEHASLVAGDDVYCCLGTTIKVAGTREAFAKVDHDYPVEVARLARAAGAQRMALVSSVGASARASSFYLRVKGETERDLEALGYPCLELFRPSLLLGERKEHRTGEGIAKAASRVFAGALVGGLRRYRPVEGDTVARAMIQALLRGEAGTHVREYAAIRELADGGHLRSP